MKILIDTDPGVDDAVALGLILSRKDIDVIGITCVAGNVNVDQTTINMLKILEVYDRKDIPVFKGCSSAILCKNGSYLLIVQLIVEVLFHCLLSETKSHYQYVLPIWSYNI